MNNWKKIGIGVAVAALTLITCYAVFAQQLVQNPSTIMSNQKGIWDIGFVDAKLKNLTGQATIISDVKYNKLFGTFSVGIAEKNDSATYDFTIKNEGKLDAVVDNIYIIPSNKPYDLVLFSATGLKRGDVLNVGDKIADLYMNDKSKSVFSDMVGKNMMSCHKQSSQDKIKHLLSEKATNVYTIQKGDVKKMIYQTPWYVDGEIKGLVEYSIILPDEMPHYVR